mgnify:CR=1 FL=1
MSIGLTTVVLFAVFGILLFSSCPISVSIIIASIVTAISSLSWDQITFITMQKMNSGVESFSLLAIPLFILAGNIMNNGGIARRLVNFSKLFVGWIPGSLAQANIVGNMPFSEHFQAPPLPLHLLWVAVSIPFRKMKDMILRLQLPLISHLLLPAS